jgi:hypothetical protein
MPAASAPITVMAPSGAEPGAHNGERATPFTLSVGDAARLMRLQGTLAAVVDELRGLPEGSVGTARLSALVEHLLDGVDSVVPRAVLGELQRLIKEPTPTGEPERDLRLVLAALDGWLQGLAVELQMVIAAPGATASSPDRPAAAEGDAATIPRSGGSWRMGRSTR